MLQQCPFLTKIDLTRCVKLTEAQRRNAFQLLGLAGLESEEAEQDEAEKQAAEVEVEKGTGNGKGRATS